MSFDDERRLRALADYRVLDTPEEEPFDNIARLTARLFRAPICLITLVAEHRQWFKAHHGLTVSETPREHSFCEHAIRQDATLLVPDALLDPRFARNPYVLGAPNIRFYCGVPLRTPDGHGLGSLCIIDLEPRALRPEEVSLLEGLARQVELELEIRRRLALLDERLEQTIDRLKSKELLAAMLVHDMRGPLTAMTMLASSVKPADDGSAVDLEALLAECERLRHMLADILDVCLHEVGGMRLRRLAFPLDRAALEVAHRIERATSARGSSVHVDAAEAPLRVDADPELVTRLLENLLANAIQHARGTPRVTLTLRRAAAGRVACYVTDQNTTIPEAERTSIFQPWTQGLTPTAHRGHGLGLAFCRLAVEAHAGTITVLPGSSGSGNTFAFDLPAAS